MAIPGEKISNRPLHFFWLADTSYSMSGDKIEALNHAIRNVIPLMVRESEEYPQVRLTARAIKFSEKAEWIVKNPVEIKNFEWHDLEVEGTTAMGEALSLVADAFNEMKSERGLPPVLVLVTDGYPTDDFHKGLEALNKEPWGKKSVRIAIGVGEDFDEELLREFVGEQGVFLQARNTDQLIDAIKWASTVVVKSNIVSEGKIANEEKSDKEAKFNSDLPEYVPDEEVCTDDVW